MATKKKIFNDSDSENEGELKINKNYASRYNVWRQKEELQKFKDRYGEDAGDSDSSSDDENLEIDPNFEKDFFTTLSKLKAKDPKIYEADVKFFSDKPVNDNETKGKQKKSKPVYLKDHERELLLSKNGELSDIDEDEDKVENKKIKINFQNVSSKESEVLKQSFKNIPIDEEDEDEDLFSVRKKTEKEKEKEEADFIEWMKGNQEDVDDTDAKTEMKCLHDYWNNPKLSRGEKFLKEYILEKKYMDEEDEERIPSYDEIIHDFEGLSDDEKTLSLQETFEHKYTYRYEEPDQDFIKRYPRTMKDTFRKQDDKRKKKRVDLKEKKLEEKERKKEELMQLKALKRKEIMDKLEKLQQITGNVNTGFDKEFLKGDFDPDEHEKKMREIFDDEYYGEGEGDESKPEFEEDEEIDGDNINWDEYEGGDNNEEEYYEPHCEDPEFNMDADYQPGVSYQQEIIDKSRKGKRKKKSKFAELVQTKKPVYNENEKTFEEYIEEYYKLDYEDVIGDLPCRFKYRETVPNDFGLSVEEILKADDKELNKWASLKKTFKYRNEEKEKYEVKAYRKMANDMDKKKKILISVYTENEEEIEEKEENNEEPKGKKKKLDEVAENGEATTSNDRKKSKKFKRKFNSNHQPESKISDDRLRAYGINPKRYNNKLKYGNKNKY